MIGPMFSDAIKAPQDRVDILPQERVTGEVLRGRGPRRGNLEDLLRYWRPIMRKPGGFRRCVIILADHPSLSPPQRICAWLHHETTGKWPNEGNHHGTSRRGKKRRGKRTARRALRRRKGADIEGIETQMLQRGLARREGRDVQSVLYQPLSDDDNLIDLKINRFLEGAVSFVLPGEAHPFRISPTRQVAYSLLFPGGSSIGPKIGGRRVGGSSLLRCPAGFENGGQFSNRTLSNCGRQLFTQPGGAVVDRDRKLPKASSRERSGGKRRSSEPAKRVVAAAKEPKNTNSADLTVEQTRNAEKANLQGVPPKKVGRNSAKAQNTAAGKISRAMHRAKPEKNAFDVQRLVRRDGTAVTPAAPISAIAKQRDNDDLEGGIFVSAASKPDSKTGLNQLDLFATGLRELRFVLPGKATVAVGAKKKLNGRDVASLKKAARKLHAETPNSDPVGTLRRLAEESDLLTVAEQAPGKGANDTVTVKVNGIERNVRKWVYDLFMAPGAPHRPKGKQTAKLAEAEKAAAYFEDYSRKAANFGPVDREWGPLEYTASLIPRSSDEAYFAGVDYKIAGFVQTTGMVNADFEEKGARAVWDPDLSRYRCPPGVANGGRITNRIGIGCGAGIVRRAVGSAARVAQGKNPVTTGRGATGTAQQAARVSPRQARRQARNVRKAQRGAKKPGKVRQAANRLADRLDPDVLKEDLDFSRALIDFGDNGVTDDLERLQINPLPAQRERFGRIGRAIDNLLQDVADNVDPDTLTSGGRRAREVRQAARRGRRLRRANQIDPDVSKPSLARSDRLANPFRRDADDVAELRSLNDRQKDRIVNAAEAEFERLDQVWADVIGRRDFTFRDIQAAVRRHERGGKARKQSLELMRRNRDDWAELRAALDLPGEDEIDADEVVRAVRRLGPERRRRVMDEGDLGETAAALEEVRKDMRAQGVERRRNQAKVRNRLRELEDATVDENNIADIHLFVAEMKAMRADAAKREKEQDKRYLELPDDTLPQVRERERLKALEAIERLDQYDQVIQEAQELVTMKRAEFRTILKRREADRKLAAEKAKEAGTPPKLNLDNVKGVRGATPRSPAKAAPERVTTKNEAMLGNFDKNGYAAFEEVPVGSNGLSTLEDAQKHLLDGGDLAAVPDEFLIDAIRGAEISRANPDGRFKLMGSGGGVNGMMRYRDLTTGQKIGIKYDDPYMYGVNEDFNEVLGAHLTERFGFAGGAVRKGKKYNGSMRDGRERDKEWNGVVVELADNYVGEDYLAVESGNDAYGFLVGAMHVEPENVLRATFLDYAGQNSDRHEKNFFLQEEGFSGEYKFIPIDHGLNFGGREGRPWYREHGGSESAFRDWLGRYGVNNRGGQINPMMLGLAQRVQAGEVSRGQLIAMVKRIQKDLIEQEKRSKLQDHFENIRKLLGKSHTSIVRADGIFDGTPALFARMDWIMEASAADLVDWILDAAA